MSVTRDILACYSRPRAVFERRTTGDEGTALTYVIVAGIIVFTGLLPGLARQAHLSPEDGNLPSLGYSAFLGAVFIAPLVMYVFSMIIWLILRLAGADLSGVRVRLVLFWSYLAVAPVMLLRGLTEGFVGSGSALAVVSAATGIAFLLFISIGVRVALYSDRGQNDAQ